LITDEMPLTRFTLSPTMNSSMSLPGQLYKLQQVDIETEKKRQMLAKISQQLNENEALIAVESKLASQKQQLADVGRQQKNAEWELEDLQSKSDLINSKLYSGVVKNPKELTNLEQEAKNLKAKLSRKEDELLELMSQVEGVQAEVRATTEELKQVKQEWKQRQEMLNQRKVKVEAELSKLSESREELAQQISLEAFTLYEQIRLIKGEAVAKVEQGRCQGCHITLPISQWQKAKAGKLVQCSSCNRILYLE